MKMDMSASPMANDNDDDDKEPSEWEVKDAADTLTRAEEIKKNKKLMPHVHKHLKKKLGIITSIEGLRQKSQQLNEGEDEDY